MPDIGTSPTSGALGSCESFGLAVPKFLFEVT